MPVTAGWLCLLIGLADIVEVVRPGLFYTSRLSRIHQFVPGTLVNVTHTVSVIIGLLLLMLSHGLKRRKRRAWEAVTVLLAVSVVVHVIPFRHDRIITAVVSALLVAALLYFRREFYAVGDPRTRWRALWVFLGLVVADVAIGLTYILLARGLAQDYSLWQRVVHVVYGLVGVSGPVHFVPEKRSDLFSLLTGTLGLFTLIVTAYLFFRPARPRPAGPAGLGAGPGPAEEAGRPGLPGLLHAAQRQEHHLVADRQVLHRLPGGLRRHAGRRRPAGRPGSLARGHPRVPRRGRPARLGARRDGLR